MRLLTLVRHAKSSWDQPKLDDFERPLNDRGRRDAPLMAQRVARLIGRPDRIVTSPALRAISTARSFAETLRVESGELVVQSSIYEASVETLFKLVRGLDEADRHVMMFGHNPGFTDLAHELARCPFDEMPTCAVVQIELGVKIWTELNYGVGTVLQYLYPKQSA
jgi:phosphohistidine phosphatase